MAVIGGGVITTRVVSFASVSSARDVVKGPGVIVVVVVNVLGAKTMLHGPIH